MTPEQFTELLERVRQFRELGARRVAIGDVEVEFFAPYVPDEQADETGFQRRQRTTKERMTLEEYQQAMDRRRHDVLFGSTNMIPHIPTPKKKE